MLGAPPIAAKDAVIVSRGGTAGAHPSKVSLDDADLTQQRQIAAPDASGTLPLLESTQTFTGQQTFRAANAIRSEVAATQDAIVIAGRAGGTSSYEVTLTPTTLTADRIVTAPNASGTLPLLESAQTFTGQQTLTQPILLPDGTTALPALARSAGSSTGISWSGTATQISVAGVRHFAWIAGSQRTYHFASNASSTLLRANGTEAAPSKVLSGQILGDFVAGGYYDDGVGGIGYDFACASIRAYAAEDFSGATNTGTYFGFTTTAIGSGTAAVRWRINPSGQLCFGDTDALATFSVSTVTPPLQLVSTSAAGHNIGLARFNADANGTFLYGAKSKVSAVGSYTATAAGDTFLTISGQGVDTTATQFRESAQFRLWQDAAGGATAVPGRASVFTVTAGGTLTEALRIDSAQQVQSLATTASTSTTTGGAVFSGGIGVAKQAFIGDKVNLASIAGSTTNGDVWQDSTQKALQTYVDGVEQTLIGTIFTQTATRTIANTVTETSLLSTGVGTLTLPANFFVAGKTIRITIGGNVADTGTPTVQLRLKVGGTTLIDSGAITFSSLTTTEEFRCVADIVCRTAGVGGTVAGDVWLTYDTSSGSSAVNGLDIPVATASLDTTVSGALDLTFQWGTASASNTISSFIASVEVLN